jgi:hypothetical protein
MSSDERAEAPSEVIGVVGAGFVGSGIDESAALRRRAQAAR